MSVRPPTAGARGAAERLRVGDLELEVVRRGAGRPLLLLHGFQNVDPGAPLLDGLARHAEVIAPSHPGFGHSPRPDGFETVYDLVHLYLELIESLPGPVTLVGLSFGGWLAAEIAVATARAIDRLVLVDALGIKVSGRETPDVLDVFNTHPREVRRLSWHDAERAAPDLDRMPDEALVVRARNWEALCLYGWHPYMHNPRLRAWLRRIARPTLVLWGASDGIVSPSYGRSYAGQIPGARFEVIAAAGHHPELEQPDAFVERLSAFLHS